MRFVVATLVSLALATSGHARAWTQSLAVIGSGFYDHFRFDNIADPTHGRVTYVDRATADANNLTYADGNTFVLRTDSTNVISAGGAGRQSVRLVSLQTFRHHAAIFDVRHMPQGCATWPAIWEAGLSDWPNEGEVDIVEGVNNASPNRMTLHTSPGCTIPATSDQTGSTLLTDCNTLVNGNAGCTVADPRGNSFGPGFNANGGGLFAMERTETFIKVWFWPRNGSPPAEVRDGHDNINTDNWGTPTALFPNTSCDIEGKFAANNIIINLTLCGDWAGGAFAGNGCPGSCVDYVNNNPSAFADAYFNLGSVRVYQ